jgi:hypothetical protein
MEFFEQVAEKDNSSYLELANARGPEWLQDFEKFWLMSEEVGLSYSLTEVQND